MDVCVQGLTDRLAAETLLLDYLYHCSASQCAELRGGSATLGALCSAAQRSMHALEAAGLPAMALEALSMAKALCTGAPSATCICGFRWPCRFMSLPSHASPSRGILVRAL